MFLYQIYRTQSKKKNLRKVHTPALSSTLKKLGRRPNGLKKPRKKGAERIRDYWDIQRLN